MSLFVRRSPSFPPWLWIPLAVASCTAVDRAPSTPPSPRFAVEALGEVTLPHRLSFAGGIVGGLSSLTYDAARGVYYALSDDRSERAPARFYTLAIDLADGSLDEGDVRILAVTTLLAPEGTPYPPRSLDPEGLAVTADGRLVLSSEGDPQAGSAPFVREIARDGSFRRELALPAAVLAGAGGVRENYGFEALAVTPGGDVLTGTENALLQDGPAAGIDRPSPARLLRFDLASGRLEAQYLYWTEPLHAAPRPADAFAANGLVELVALDEERFLALERGFAAGVGVGLRLFLITTTGATDIAAHAALAGATDGIRPVRKRLLLDFAGLGVTLDNFESLTFGPPLADGRRTLLLVADDNFDPRQQTLILALALAGDL